MFEPERLRLVIVFYHARLLALEIYPGWAIIFDCFFEVCRDLCAVGSCGVLAFQDWLELVHGGRVKGGSFEQNGGERRAVLRGR